MKEPTPLERLTNLTRAVVSVPKSEIDKREKAYARKRARKAKRRADKGGH